MLASGAVLGLIAGVAFRRDWRGVAGIRVRWLPLLVAGSLGRVVAGFAPEIALALYVFGIVSTIIVSAANYRLTGAVLIALGGFMNLAVVVANGGMPVDATALMAAGAVMPTDALHVPFGIDTRLMGLGDVIGFAFFHAVYSIGDFLIAAGGFIVPFAYLLRK